jgi:hypothetical protein
MVVPNYLFQGIPERIHQVMNYGMANKIVKGGRLLSLFIYRNGKIFTD